MPRSRRTRVQLATVAALAALTAASAQATGSGGPQQGRYEPTLASLDKHKAAKWFNDAKLGIFIHWGVYSVPAWAPVVTQEPVGGFPYTFNFQYAEWYWQHQQQPGTPQYDYHAATYGPTKTYDEFVNQWRAEKWNPDEWIKLFKDAGAKYFVLTSKHHEGWTLFPSRTTNRTSVNYGPRRDLVGDLFKSARKLGGIHPGLYYSVYEWYHPAYKGINNSGMTLFNGPAGPPKNAYTQQEVPYLGYKPITNYTDQHLVPQIHEIVDNYKPEVLWCDGAWDNQQAFWKTNEWEAYYYNHEITPTRDVVINDRCGGGSHGDFTTPEYSTNSTITIPKWEATRGIGFSFGYNAQEDETNYATGDYLVGLFTDIVSKNGNLLLDVGPRADGTIDERQLSRLKYMGDWLKINGEAIYGSHYWTVAEEGAGPGVGVPGVSGGGASGSSADPNTKPSGLRFTVQPNAFYIIAESWPGATLKVTSKVPINKGDTVTLLGSNGKPLAWTKDSNGNLLVTTPAAGPASTRSKGTFTFKITPKRGTPPLVRNGVLTPTGRGERTSTGRGGTSSGSLATTGTPATLPLAALGLLLLACVGTVATRRFNSTP